MDLSGQLLRRQPPVQSPPTSPVPESTPNVPAHPLPCTTALLEHCAAAPQASTANPPKLFDQRTGQVPDQWWEPIFHRASSAYGTPIDREAGQHCAAAFEAPLTRTAKSEFHLNELMLSIPHSAIPFFEKNGCIPEKMLGQGAGGVVVQALSPTEDKKVAIKVVDRTESLSFGITPSNEVASLEKVQGCSNIINLYGVETTDDFLFIIMELAEAGSLLNYIQINDELSERTCQSLFRDLMTGIKHCHDNDVVHGDIHSQNLLLDKNGSLKLSDFGLARIGEDDQHDGRALDIWNAGAVLFHMIYGYEPFDLDESKLSEAHDIRPSVSDGCNDLIRNIATSENPLTLSEIFHHPWMRV